MTARRALRLLVAVQAQNSVVVLQQRRMKDQRVAGRCSSSLTCSRLATVCPCAMARWTPVAAAVSRPTGQVGMVMIQLHIECRTAKEDSETLAGLRRLYARSRAYRHWTNPLQRLIVHRSTLRRSRKALIGQDYKARRNIG